MVVETSAAVLYETTTVFDSARSRWNPSYSLSGINATWVSQKGVNFILYFYDGAKTNAIANSLYDSLYEFAISGGSVAYTKQDGPSRGLYLYRNGVTSKITSLSKDSYIDSLLINGDTIAWKAWDDAINTEEIYRYDGKAVSRVTNNTAEEYDIQLSGNQLAWASSDGNDYEIYLHDGTSTRALTNNSLDDYSPVLSGNKAAWLQWNNGQENLFFFDGTTSRQVTTDWDIYNPVIAGDNLVFQRLEETGKYSLYFYNAATKSLTQLSEDLGPLPFGSRATPRAIEVSGNLVAWLENELDEVSNFVSRATLKLFNGSQTIIVNDNAMEDSQNYSYAGPDVSEKYSSARIALRGNKLFYLARSTGGGGLFVYDAANPSAGSIQLTEDQNIYSLTSLSASGDRVLWSDYSGLKLTQPKPSLKITAPAAAVVEGLTTPQNATLTVTLSSASATAVSVNYETATIPPGSANAATPGSDYTTTSGVLTFAAGVTSRTITIPIVNDALTEEDETFQVRLFDPSNAVLAPGLETATITLSDTWQATGANGSSFTLPAGVENLTLTGTTNIHAIGNLADNVIRGNSGNNRLDGGNGQDTVSYASAPASVTVNLLTGAASGWGTDTLSGFENILGSRFNDTLTGDAANNILTGGSGADRLTGQGGADKFDYRVLAHSRFGSTMDVITDFTASPGGDAFLVSSARAGFLNAGQATAFTSGAIAAKLTATTFLPNYAATVQVGSGATTRWFVAINNATAGFNASDDALIEVTGLTGTIGASHFVTS